MTLNESFSTRPDGALAFPMSRQLDASAYGGTTEASASVHLQRQRRPRHPPPPVSSHSASSFLVRSRNRRGSINYRLRRGDPGLERRGSSGSGSSSSWHDADVVLSPRADAWIYLCASSFVGIASLARAHVRYSSNPLNANHKLGASSIAIIALLSINAVVALGVGAAYRFKPSLLALSKFHLEFASASFALLLWGLCTVFYNFSVDAGGMMTDMKYVESNRWDANFFYSLWAAGISNLYLVADLCVGNHPTGMIAMTTATSTTTAITSTDATARLWMLLLFSSILLLSFSIGEKLGVMCEGSYLQDSPYCTSTMVAIVTSVLGILLCLARMASSHLSDNTQIRRQLGGLPPAVVKNTSEQLLALPILVGYACNAGFTTSPGGSGANMGNLFIATWLNLILALALNVNYLGLHFTADAGHVSGRHSVRSTMEMLSKQEQMGRKLSRNVLTDSEESDDEDEDATVLPPTMMYNSVANGRGRRPPRTSGASLATERSATLPRGGASVATERSTLPSARPRGAGASLATERSRALPALEYSGARSVATERSGPAYSRNII